MVRARTAVAAARERNGVTHREPREIADLPDGTPRANACFDP
jgi:hypothetical protein